MWLIGSEETDPWSAIVRRSGVWLGGLVRVSQVAILQLDPSGQMPYGLILLNTTPHQWHPHAPFGTSRRWRRDTTAGSILLLRSCGDTPVHSWLISDTSHADDSAGDPAPMMGLASAILCKTRR